MASFYGNITKYLEKAFSHFLLRNQEIVEKPTPFPYSDETREFSLTADKYRDGATFVFGNRWIQFKSENGLQDDATITIQHNAPDYTLENQNDSNKLEIDSNDISIRPGIFPDGPEKAGTTLRVTGLTYDNAGHINGVKEHTINLNIRTEIEERIAADKVLQAEIDSLTFKHSLPALGADYVTEAAEKRHGDKPSYSNKVASMAFIYDYKGQGHNPIRKR